MKRFLSYYLPLMPHRLVYMLQQVEYKPSKLVEWLSRLPDLTRVMRRKSLVTTKKARALLLVSYGVYVLVLTLSVWQLVQEQWWAILLLLLVPVLTAVVLMLTVWTGYKLLNLIRRPLLGQAKAILKEHQATKIAVLGSYGKTTMKELLVTVLAEGKRVKATPGNMNVPISHARWITSKVGADEEVLIFEYGEGKPGDIECFARITQPDYAVITGLAPNHLDHYPSLAAVAEDLLSIRQFVADDHILMNQAAQDLAAKATGIPTYSLAEVKGWHISEVKVDYDGTHFVMKKGDTILRLHSALLGKHQVGPLAAVAALAHELGLTAGQIEKGVAQTKPFEHRMEPRALYGAWLIDDTYNGNLEGIRAGLQLLNDLEAERKIYITPGLVDQGVETERVHIEIGGLIAAAKPDKVVLMKNSVLKYIQQGLEAAQYKGEVEIIDDPLEFYSNIEHTLAAGDLVMIQNDWTDNYQ